MKTYEGFVSNSAGEKHAATLRFDDPAQQTGNISNGYMDYFGLNFPCTGTGTKSTWTYKIQAKSDAKDRDELNHGPSTLFIDMKSTDGTDKTLEGTVTVKAGGPNVGQSFRIQFTKS
ncbi:hypothetical protein [Pseudomonas protegens]